MCGGNPLLYTTGIPAAARPRWNTRTTSLCDENRITSRLSNLTRILKAFSEPVQNVTRDHHTTSSTRRVRANTSHAHGSRDTWRQSPARVCTGINSLRPGLFRAPIYPGQEKQDVAFFSVVRRPSGIAGRIWTSGEVVPTPQKLGNLKGGDAVKL
jgi:hypothetical protein